MPELLGIANPADRPFAEVWLGAHPALPARLAMDEDEVPFDELLGSHGAAFLGSGVMGAFGGLPYLLKILAAAQPLSIQVHPTKAQAEEGFRREEAAGVPRDAPHRGYRDANHKPEVLVALTPFHALSGFRTLEEIGTVLEGLRELAGLLPSYAPTPDGLRALLEAYLALPDDRIQPALARLVERLREEHGGGPGAMDDPVYWLLEADRVFSSPGRVDRGLLFVLLLELVHLEPGEALFQPARVPHAYLRGAGVELMANSDNVLRCGLTPKHIDAHELLRIVDFQPTGPVRVQPHVGLTSDHRVYETPAREFALAEVSIGPGRIVDAVAHGTDTLVVTGAGPEATVRVAAPDGVVELARGGACVVPHGVAYTLGADAPATLFRASVPAAIG